MDPEIEDTMVDNTKSCNISGREETEEPSEVLSGIQVTPFDDISATSSSDRTVVMCTEPEQRTSTFTGLTEIPGIVSLDSTDKLDGPVRQSMQSLENEHKITGTKIQENQMTVIKEKSEEFMEEGTNMSTEVNQSQIPPLNNDEIDYANQPKVKSEEFMEEDSNVVAKMESSTIHDDDKASEVKGQSSNVAITDANDALCDKAPPQSENMVEDNTDTSTDVIIPKALVQSLVVIEDYGSSSPDSDSSSSDTDTSSDSDSESESDSSSQSEDDKCRLHSDVGSDGDEESTRERKFGNPPPAPRTASEQVLEDLPEVEILNQKLSEDIEVKELGHVSSIIGQLVVIQSLPNNPALDMDTVLFTANRECIGKIYEVFGPVSCPLYAVRFNSIDHIKSKSIELQTKVFFVVGTSEFTMYVFLQQLQQMKGSDASWKNDEEPPDEFLDYSDDEQEKEAKAKLRNNRDKRKRKRNAQRNVQQETNDTSISEEHNHQRNNSPQISHHGRGGWRGSNRSTSPRVPQHWQNRPRHGQFREDSLRGGFGGRPHSPGFVHPRNMIGFSIEQQWRHQLPQRPPVPHPFQPPQGLLPNPQPLLVSQFPPSLLQSPPPPPPHLMPFPPPPHPPHPPPLPNSGVGFPPYKNIHYQR